MGIFRKSGKAGIWFGVPFILVLILAIIAVAMFFDVEHELGLSRESMQENDQTVVNLLKNNTQQQLRIVSSDLKTIAKMQTMVDYLNDPQSSNKIRFEKDFFDICQNRGEYDQIRLVATDGMEVIRVNYNSGLPNIVNEKDLQDKKHRYYFTKSLELPKGGIYISPLDLNIENKAIELPFKPMIRYGTPVFDSRGNKKGVLLLNYLAGNMLNYFELVESNSLGAISLVNENGYFLHGFKNEDEWGFMFPGKKNSTFINKFPQLWKTVTTEKNGSLVTDDGIFTYARLNILSSRVLGEDFEKSKADESGWFIISHISQDMVDARNEHIYHSSLISFIFIFGGLALVFIIFYKYQSYQKEKEKDAFLRDAAQEWLDTFNSVEDMIVIFEKTGHIKQANRAFTQCFKPLESSLCRDIFRCFANMAEVCNTCNIFNDKKIMRREIFSQIDKRWYDFIATPVINDDGSVREVIHSFRDITMKKLSQQELADKESFLRRSQSIGKIGSWSVDFAEKKICYSEEVCAIFDTNPDILGDTFEGLIKFVHKDDIKDVTKRWQMMVSDNIMQNFNFRIVTNAGIEKVLSVQGEFIENDANNIVRVDGIIQDITEKHLLSEQLRQSEKLKSVGQLAGGIAHDFNNQLAAIIGYGEMVYNKLDEGPLKKYCEYIVTSGKSAADLTKQLLAFSRKGQQKCVPLDIHKLVDETIAILMRSIDKRIKIERVLNAEVSTIEGDPSFLQNALLNLCINARDAMPEGGTITISSENLQINEYTIKHVLQELQPGPHILLSVSDTGAGIPKDIQDRIFDPFFTTKEEGKGTGMGLAAVFGTIKQHNGSVSLYSEEGCGARFNIYLPLTGQSLNVDKNTIKKVERKLTATIMVVDDERIVRDLAKDILTEVGYTVIAEADPNKAVEIFRDKHSEIDLVLIDIIMPGMSGGELLKVLMAIEPEVKVLVASGYSFNENAQMMLDSGALEFINKPFLPTTLETAVQRALGCAESVE